MSTDTISNTSSVVTEANKGQNMKEEHTISSETSYSFFSGDLTISLVGIAFEGDPLLHRVVANVSSPNGQVVKIDRLDIGNVITYKSKNTYKIIILSAETFSATFQVVKLNTNDN
ncbi:MAG: hypothetical protein IPK46_22525 [Saprospiraceae bacterium]|nr:hypothetical protein [Saprospiraceae bacterium]